MKTTLIVYTATLVHILTPTHKTWNIALHTLAHIADTLECVGKFLSREVLVHRGKTSKYL